MGSEEKSSGRHILFFREACSDLRPPSSLGRTRPRYRESDVGVSQSLLDVGARIRPDEPTVTVKVLLAFKPADVTQYQIELNKPATNGDPACRKLVQGIICEALQKNALGAVQQPGSSVKVTQLPAMTEDAFNKSAVIAIGIWWNQSSPSTQPKKLKAEWLKNKRAAAEAPAGDQEFKRTNKESLPGGGGHVTSDNEDAGVAL